eukprot:3941502-Rhodomonas_salina.2
MAIWRTRSAAAQPSSEGPSMPTSRPSTSSSVIRRCEPARARMSRALGNHVPQNMSRDRTSRVSARHWTVDIT